MRSQLSSNDYWACPTPAPSGAVCIRCALGVLIVFHFLSLSFVVLEFLLFGSWSISQHLRVLLTVRSPYLWVLTIVLPAPSFLGMAYLNVLGGVL